MSDITADNSRIKMHVTRSLIPLVLVVGIGIVISIAAFFSLQQSERNARESAFDRVAHDRAATLQSKIQNTFSVLQSIRGLYAASDNVDRQGFHRFVTTVGLGPAVQALEWIPRVALSDRAEMEAVAKRDGVAGFRFTERRAQGDMVRAANREAYFPVYFVEPVAGNEAAIGFDLASSPARLAALEHTRDSGKAVATPRITLVQETGDQYGILVFMPIYQNGMPTESREERRANLAGFALGVFRIGDIGGDPVLGDSMLAGDGGHGLSPNLRIRVIEAVEAGSSRRGAAARFGVSVSSAIRFDVWRRTGRIPIREAVTGGRDGSRARPRSVEETPDITLAELQALLKERDLSVGTGTVWRFFDRHGISFKKNRARRRAGAP